MHLRGNAVLRALVPLACLSTITAAGVDHGSRRIVSLKGTCEVTVPAEWRVDKWISSDANAPDHSAAVVIDSDVRAASLSALKPLAQSLYRPIRVFEDGPHRLWFEYRGAADSATHWYVSVPGNAGICAAQISFQRPVQEGLARRIVMSVRPAN